MFLPLYLAILSIWLIKEERTSFKKLLPLAGIIFIIEIPIIIFAIRSNIESLNTDLKILWWTSPRLAVGRVAASFIGFDGNILENIFRNLASGFSMYINGTDLLSWNSVGNMGPYYMFASPFFITGFITMFRRRKNCDIFILSALVAMVPIMMIVTPNYNHWIFLHFPVLLVIMAGISSILRALSRVQIQKNFLIAVTATYLLFFTGFSYQYFSPGRYTGWETSAISALQVLESDHYDKVYFDSDNGDFLYFIRFCLPVSPYEYQKTRDNPYSKTHLGTQNHYANFERIGEMTIKKNSLFIVENYKTANYKDFLSNLHPIATFTFQSQQYDVYKF